MDTNFSNLEGRNTPVKTLTNRANQWPKICIDSLVDDARLSTSAFRVYLHLWRRGDNETHVSWPGVDSIARVCCLNKKTVLDAIKELEDRRFIKVKRRQGKQSNYEILPKHCWAPDRSEIGNGTVTQNGPLPLPKTDHHQSEIGNVRYPKELYPKKEESNLGWSRDKTKKEYLNPSNSPDPKTQGSVARLAKDFLRGLKQS